MLGTMPKKKPGRSKDDSAPPEKAVLYVEVAPYIKRAMDDLARRHHRKLTGEVTQALQEYLERAGLWPPPAKEGPTT